MKRSEALVIPASAYADVLVGPCRVGTPALTTVERFRADLAIRIEPLRGEIARRAAQLRGRTAALGLPDAFVIATGDVLDASAVLTADRALLTVSRRVGSI